MTHASNISIPARFVFRPYRVQWQRTWATIARWGEIRHDFSNMRALMGGPLFTPKEDYVLVYLGVPRDKDNLHERGYDIREVELKRGDLPPYCLHPSETPETVPDISGREMELLVCRLEDVDGSGASWQPDESEKDAWEMREQFFGLENDISALRRFLTRWGLWSFIRTYEKGTLTMHPFAIVFPHQLWSLRQSYIKAAVGSPRAWLSTTSPLSLKETDKRPYFKVERHYCEEAIKATITIDHLGNARFGMCKRHDCRKLFKRKTAQKRFYCSPECAHLANVRKLRKAKAKTTRKGTKKDAKG